MLHELGFGSQYRSTNVLSLIERLKTMQYLPFIRYLLAQITYHPASLRAGHSHPQNATDEDGCRHFPVHGQSPRSSKVVDG